MTALEVFEKKYSLNITPKMKDEFARFNPREEYKINSVAPLLSAVRHRILVGKAGRLIRDMAMNKAAEDEIIKAIKYSMVAIDAKKYKLDYKKAANDFDISELYNKYNCSQKSSPVIKN